MLDDAQRATTDIRRGSAVRLLFEKEGENSSVFALRHVSSYSYM